MLKHPLASLEKSGSGPHRILVVDDEPDLERLVRLRMRREIRKGVYEMHFARNGVEALELLGSNQKYDLVLSDINMPRMDGLTLLAQIPNVDPDIRAVIVSAYGDMKNIRTAMNRGAFDFVTKPIDFKDLRITIRRTLTNLEVWRDALKSRDRLVAIENELDVARRMQAAILPKVFARDPTYDLHARMEPAKAVGGDFYDVVKLEDGKIGVAVADVSGKGVPAALFMMSSRTLLKGAAVSSVEPGTVLRSVNDLLTADNAEQMFVTLVYAVFSPRTGMLNYASGGHDPPIVLHPDGTTTQLPGTGGIALGVLSEMDFDSHQMRLEPGDLMLLFTDGVTEAQNAAGEQFGLEALRKVLQDRRPVGAREATRTVLDAVQEFSGSAEQFDDFTCMALARRE